MISISKYEKELLNELSEVEQQSAQHQSMLECQQQILNEIFKLGDKNGRS